MKKLFARYDVVNNYGKIIAKNLSRKNAIGHIEYLNQLCDDVDETFYLCKI